MKLLTPFIATAITLAVLAWLLPSITIFNWVTLVLAALVLTILQKVVRPILGILFLPINIVTLGFFSLVLNVVVLWTATYLVPGFTIEPMTVMGVQLNYFFTLLFTSFLISFVQSIVNFII